MKEKFFQNIPKTFSFLSYRISLCNLIFFIKIFCENNFDKNDSDMNFILLQRRFDASCIIFKLQVRTIRITFTFS